MGLTIHPSRDQALELLDQFRKEVESGSVRVFSVLQENEYEYREEGGFRVGYPLGRGRVVFQYSYDVR